MAISIFNHNKRKNGSHWVDLMRNGKAEEILIVAIDIGKYTHKTLMANVFGDVLVQPLEIDASLTGFKMLCAKIDETCATHSCKEVVVGIETTAHYYEDLVRLCHQEGYIVRIINSATTAFEREVMLNWSKTDNIDLSAIVHSILQGRGSAVIQSTKTLDTLKKFTRFRRGLVNQRTRINNQRLTLMDHIFREFQGKSVWIDGKRTHRKPFSTLDSKAVLYLMRNFPHPEDMLTLGADGLREISRKENLKLRDTSIDCLLEFAEGSASKPKADLEAELYQLRITLDSYEQISEHIKDLEKKIEEVLLRTDGALLLSIPGMAVVTAAELRAEMGQVENFTHAGQLIKMAGTNPIVKQSGGHQATHGSISKQGRRQFRNIVYLVGKGCSTTNPDLREHYIALKEKGKKTRQAYIANGNRMLRIAFAMLKRGELYQSKNPNYCLKSQIERKLSTKKARSQFYVNYVVSSITLVS